MSEYYRRIEERNKRWMARPLSRMNHTYSILRARRAKMDDDDPRKNGIMLTRCRKLEAAIMAEDENEAIKLKAYYNAAELSDQELRKFYSISTTHNDTCGECFCCICGVVIADRAAGKEQAFPFEEVRV